MPLRSGLGHLVPKESISLVFVALSSISEIYKPRIHELLNFVFKLIREFVANILIKKSYFSKFSNSSFLVFFFSKVKTNDGKTTKLANIAKTKVQEINPPKAIVPLKLDNVKVAKPKINTIEV